MDSSNFLFHTDRNKTSSIKPKTRLISKSNRAFLPKKYWLLLFTTISLSSITGNAFSADTFACSGKQIPIDTACGGLEAPLPQRSCLLPNDVEGRLQQKNLNIVQRATDIFSWQEFIALNWPARQGVNGIPDSSKDISAPGTRVWQTWKPLSQVFLQDGAKPPGWNESLPGPKSCSGLKTVLHRDEKADDIIDAQLQAAVADGTLPATLTDQEGNLTRYEIRINQIMFDYIVTNNLYNGDVQMDAKSINYPPGSIVIKAAWREVNHSNQERFYTTEACVCEQDEQHKPIDCRAKKMGLVGLHVTSKTPSAPQWIWSTYEQVDNVLVNYVDNKTGKTVGIHPNFYNPNCTSCPPNQQTFKGTPAQLTREIPIPFYEPNCDKPHQAVDNVQKLNQQVQGGLEGSVFSFYELVNTQWAPPLASADKELDPSIFATPAILSNLTMESYVQDTSTCMGCHSTARKINPDNFISSDFSFVLNNAEPKQQATCVITFPGQPSDDPWEKENWSSIARGYQLVSQTYEELPPYTGAKLHCTSCHLEGGGDPNAAWWVPMVEKYNYPQTQNLQARINRCFERSMNGHALCTANNGVQADNCSYNPDMNAITTYMEWLNRKGKSLPSSCDTSESSFPPIEARTGNPHHGKLAYVQKCAVCHGLNGQGRYDEHKYYRPALWGKHSFNDNAGLAKTSKMAEFLKANMPLKAGGMLTVQEAWDIATYVNECHCRPGKECPPNKRCEMPKK